MGACKEDEDFEPWLDSWMRKIWGSGELEDVQREESAAVYRDSYGLNTEGGRELAERALRVDKSKRALMTSPGKFGPASTKLIEDARWAYMIPDSAWDLQAVWDRVFVFQVPQFEGETIGSQKLIIATEQAQEREERSNCEGILISAGLTATDQLISNGIQFGHRVAFAQNYLWRKRIAQGEHGEEFVGLFLAGDICGSYEVAAGLRSGDITLKCDKDEETGLIEHYYQGKDGTQWRPSAGDAHMGDN